MWKLPIIGWFFSGIAAISMSFPFWICWTACGIGQTYFYWLPAVYRSISFWNCVGLFVVISILGILIQMLTPSIASVSNTNSANAEKKKD